MANDQDKPAIRVPPPPVYLLALLLGLLLDRRAHVPFLPRVLIPWFMMDSSNLPFGSEIR
jgi:hypothetical protein